MEGEERGEFVETLKASYCGGCSKVQTEYQLLMKVLDILKPSERV